MLLLVFVMTRLLGLQVKMLCSSGGQFAKVPGGWEYQGGETRLVSVSSDCHMQELQDALHRVSQTMRLDMSSSCGSVQPCSLLACILPCLAHQSAACKCLDALMLRWLYIFLAYHVSLYTHQRYTAPQLCP